MSQHIDLIFTRDFSLFMCDLWQELLSGRVRAEFGEGLDHQIVRFTGRSAEIYRIRDELTAMKVSVVGKTLGDTLFSNERTVQFRRDVDALREHLEEASHAKSLAESFTEARRLFTAMYPLYMLGVFLPNAWKVDFLKRHGDAGTKVLDQVYANRVHSEGLFKEMDMVYREILGKTLTKQKELRKYARVFRLAEIIEYFISERMPDRAMLDARLEGYILFGCDLLLERDFSEFLTSRDFAYADLTVDAGITEFKGQVASLGGSIRGVVQIILNTHEVQHFERGRILVTSMTSPEYVSAMKEAVAIVTNEGGVTCHAAIVSRELGIPCVIGTKVATKVLKDGDMVEVDAEKGIVRKIR